LLVVACCCRGGGFDLERTRERLDLKEEKKQTERKTFETKKQNSQFLKEEESVEKRRTHSTALCVIKSKAEK